MAGAPVPVVTLPQLNGRDFETDTELHCRMFDAFETNVQTGLTNNGITTMPNTIGFVGAMAHYKKNSMSHVNSYLGASAADTLPTETFPITIFRSAITAGEDSWARFRQNPTIGTGAQQAAAAAAAAAANTGTGGTTLTVDLQGLFNSGLTLQGLLTPHKFGTMVTMGFDKSEDLGKKIYEIGMGFVWALMKKEYDPDGAMGSYRQRQEAKSRDQEVKRKGMWNEHASNVPLAHTDGAQLAQGAKYMGDALKNQVPERERAEYRGGGPTYNIDKAWIK